MYLLNTMRKYSIFIKTKGGNIVYLLNKRREYGVFILKKKEEIKCIYKK